MDTGTVDIDKTLGTLVAENPQRARVFERFDLDYCCGGKQTLKGACDKNSLERDAVVEALVNVDRQTSHGDGKPSWDDLTDLVDHIVETHHSYLRDELPSLQKLVQKVSNVHGDKHPNLENLDETFDRLRREMRAHINEEEAALFPAIESIVENGDLAENVEMTIEELMESLEDDHQEVGDLFEKIQSITGNYTPPKDACGSYRNMLERLEHLEKDTHMHTHEENHLLFPKIRERIGE